MLDLRRRQFITLLGGTAAAWPRAARAQQDGRVRRIGVLVPYAQDDPETKARFAAFRQGLERLGWSEGRNFRIDYRFAPGAIADQTRMLAKELLAPATRARAQQPQMPVVGFLHAGTPSAFASLVTAFREGLGTAGYVEGRSVAIEYRWAENQYERLPALLTDLVSRRVAVIAALGDGPAATTKAGTSAIPVVVMAASDPVEAGLVGSLNRPGGNITGISMFTSDLMAKRIELLTELVPKTTTIGLLVNPTGRRAGADTNEAQAAARALGQQIEVLNAGSADEIDAAFITLVQRRVGALVTGTDVLFTTRYEQIAALANRYDIPTIFPWREFVTAGGLASYGITHAEPYRQVGGYVGRILKGEKVGDLPVQQPTKFELVINLKTAKALGLEVPPTLLARADEVIE